MHMKKSFYFPHDYNASNDVKCLFLRQSLGMEGYGIFWFLVEQLANAGGQLPINIVPVLAMQMQVTEAKVQHVIANFELFEIDEMNFFWSARLNDHLEIRKSLSASGKKGSSARWNREANSLANGGANSLAIGEANAKENKGKEIKEIKESKEIKEGNAHAFFSVEEIGNELSKERPLKRPFFSRMAEIHGMDSRSVLEAFKSWQVLKEGEAMTVQKAENSFNLFLQNNKKSYISERKPQPITTNVFAEIRKELQNKQEL